MTSDFEYALVVVITIYLFYVFVIVAGRGYFDYAPIPRTPFGCNVYTKVNVNQIKHGLSNRTNFGTSIFGPLGIESGPGITALRKERQKGIFCQGYQGKIYNTAVVDTPEYLRYKQEINNNGWEEYYGGIYAP